MTAMDAVAAKVTNIQRLINDIMKSAKTGTKEFDTALGLTLRNLRTAMGELRTLQQPGVGLQMLNNNQGLARATVQAGDYARGIGHARNAVEALQGKINDLNREIAGRGANGRAATIAQRDRLEQYQNQLRALQALDRQYRTLERRASGTRGGDFTSERGAINAARARLEAAALNPSRNGLVREIRAAELAQDRFSEAIARTRREQAALNREKATEANVAARLGGQSARQMAIGDAAQIRDLVALDAARLASATRLRDLRAQLRTANTEESRQILEKIQLERAVGQQLNRNLAELRAQTREMEKQRGVGGAGGGGAGSRFGLPAGGFPTVLARTAAYGAAGMGVFAVISGIQQGLTFVVQLEDAMKRLQAISASTDGSMAGLSRNIMDVGTGSRFTLLELTEMATKLAQAGVSASQMGEALGSVARLATASGSTPQEAVDLITAALGSFQLAASETPRIADMITSALNRTRLTVQQAALAIQYVGSTAYEQNISLEQLLATTAALSQAGIRSGSTIGTGMRQFLVDLQSPTERLRETLTALNLTSADVDVTTRGLPAVLQTLSRAGFGAAQAYGSLETRAAAFYLTARNNTDLMADLQMQFAEQGAAMVANERAMDSLAAQWQRFQNILGGEFAESAQGILNLFRDLLRSISDNMVEARRLAAGRDQRLAGPAPTTMAEAQQRIDDSRSWVLEQMGQGLVNMQNAALDLVTPQFYVGGQGWGQQWAEYTQGVNSARDANARLTTTMQEQTEAVGMHEDRLRSIDHEIQRLITQQRSLDETQGAVSAETVTLASRFEGLSQHLIGATNDVNGLIGAMRALRGEEAGLLVESIQGQVGTARQQYLGATDRRTSTAQRLLNDPEFMRMLDAREQAQLRLLADRNTPAAQRRLAAGVLSDRQQIWTREGRASLVTQLNPLLTSNAEAATALGTIERGNRRIGSLEFQQSPIGTASSEAFGRVEGLIAELRTAEDGRRQAIQREVDRILNPIYQNAQRNAGMQGRHAQDNQQLLTQIQSYRQSVTAALTPTAAQRRETDRAGRAADREAQMITFGSPVRGTPVVRSGVGPRTAPRLPGGGRGSSNHQGVDINGRLGDPVYATADGAVQFAGDRGSYGNLIILDHGGGTETRYAHLSRIGVERGQRVNRGDLIGYIGSTGGSTGPHLHYERRTRSGVDRNPLSPRARGNVGDLEDSAARIQQEEERRAERNATATDRLQLRGREQDLRGRIRDLRYGTSQEVFNAGERSVREALESWTRQLRENVENEITRGDLTEAEAQERREAAETQIREKLEEVNSSIFDAFMASIRRQGEEIERALERQLQSSQARVATEEAVATGFGLYSNRNRIPDYVQSLQQGRVAQAQEAAARARMESLPGTIAQREGLLSSLQGRLAGEADEGRRESLTSEINTLTDAITRLRSEHSALTAQFAAGGLVPTSFGEGLRQAVTAFREAQGLTRSFTEDLIFNLGGAVENVHSGLTEMFTSIMDGSKTVLQAFGDFVRGMIQYMIQLAARAAATQVFNLIFNALGAAAGGAGGNVFGANPTGGAVGMFGGGTNINGVPIGADGLARLAGGGGRVTNGSPFRDSVNAKIARDEWVVNSRAVRSVGHDFMAKLNASGAAALEGMRSTPIIQMPNQEVNVWITRPDIPRPTTKADILVAVQEDILQGGETKKLIKHVQNN